MKRKTLPSAERLRELFDYDPQTGIVTSKAYRAAKTKRKAVNVGDEVGYFDAFGYLKVTVDGDLHTLHRVIWKMVTGSEPGPYLDHANRVKSDNRWANLREATASQNTANTAPNILTFSGAKGVTIGYRGRWTAGLTTDGVHRHLGTFDTREEAVEAYNAAAVEAHGDFACTEATQIRVITDVVTLVDEQLLAAVAAAARQMFAVRLDPTIPEAAKAKLEDIGLTLSTELARIDPKNYGRMRKRVA